MIKILRILRLHLQQKIKITGEVDSEWSEITIDVDLIELVAQS